MSNVQGKNERNVAVPGKLVHPMVSHSLIYLHWEPDALLFVVFYNHNHFGKLYPSELGYCLPSGEFQKIFFQTGLRPQFMIKNLTLNYDLSSGSILQYNVSIMYNV